MTGGIGRLKNQTRIGDIDYEKKYLNEFIIYYWSIFNDNRYY